MPEKPLSMKPPEEDFAFVRNVETEDFPETWTPEARRRIAKLFEEVGWPVGMVGGDPGTERVLEAFLNAIQEENNSLQARTEAATGNVMSKKVVQDMIFTDFCTIRDHLAYARALKNSISNPVYIGTTLLRMKKILRGGA